MQLTPRFRARRAHGELPALAVVVLLALAVSTERAAAQTYTPYSVFAAMSVGDMATLEVKLTWLGPQEKGVPTRLFTASGTGNLALFIPFERPGFDYLNDDSGAIESSASNVRLKALIDSVATLPNVTDGGIDSSGVLSFALLNTVGGTKCFESIVDAANGTALFARMHAALAGAPAVRRADEMACEIEMTGAVAPPDVTGSVTARLSGVRLDRASGHFAAKLKVTNTSGSSLPAPISVVLDFESNAKLLGDSGSTCRIGPPGRPYLDVLSTGSLAPGASLEVVIQIENPDLDPVKVVPTVFAGAGAR